MAWHALWKWYSTWSKRNYPNMIGWYSHILKFREQPFRLWPKWTTVTIKEFVASIK